MRIALITSIILLGLIGSGLSDSTATAQEQPLAEDQKAVLMFDVRLDRIQDGELGKALDLKGKIGSLPGQDPDTPDPKTISRIFGAVSAPENAEAIQNIQKGGGDLPMEFFVRMKFRDSESASVQIDKMKAESEEVKIGGKTYYKPTDEDAPESILMNIIDETTMEVGTQVYLTRSDRKVFTDGLNSAWSKVPDDAFRLAFDMAGSEGLMEDVMDLGRQSIPPNFVAYIDLIGNAKDLRLSLDPDGANLLTLSATGVDSDAAEELQEGLDSLLGFAKMGGQMQIGQMKQFNPEGAEMLAELLGSLKATVSGDQVNIAIPKPAGFNKTIQKMIPGGN